MSLGARSMLTASTPASGSMSIKAVPAIRPMSMRVESESSWQQAEGSAGGKGQGSSHSSRQKSAAELRESLLKRYGMTPGSRDGGSLTQSVRAESSEPGGSRIGGLRQNHPSGRSSACSQQVSFNVKMDSTAEDGRDSANDVESPSGDNPTLKTFVGVVEEAAYAHNIHLPLPHGKRETGAVHDLGPDNYNRRPDFIIETMPSSSGSWGMFEGLLGVAPEQQKRGRKMNRNAKGMSAAEDKTKPMRSVRIAC